MSARSSKRLAAVVGLLFVAVVAVTGLPVPDAFAGSAAHGTPPPPGSRVPGAISIAPAVDWSRAGPALPSAFFGLNVRPTATLSAGPIGALARSNVVTLRFPGGALSDEYDLVDGRLYGLHGSYTSLPGSFAQFVAACRAIHCQAIVSVPGEIDDPVFAALEVRYVERTLGFAPAYWEIGNEPALWTQYARSWTNWRTGPPSTVSAAGYAAEVHAYLLAMRSVDPAVRVLGLPGTGLGASSDPAWIRATVRENGAELAGVAIHVYPAVGTGPSSTSAFFASLSGPRALGARIPTDRAAIRAACAPCASLPIFVTELGSGHGGGPFARLMAGFPQAVYVGAELVQAIGLGVANVDLFSLESEYEGSWFSPRGAPAPVSRLYDTMLPRLDRVPAASRWTGAPPGFFGAVATDPNRASATLFVVNANPVDPVRLVLGPSAFPTAGAGTLWRWSAGASGIAVGGWSQAGPSDYSLPPLTLLLVRQSLATAEVHWTGGPPVAPGVSVPGTGPGLVPRDPARVPGVLPPAVWAPAAALMAASGSGSALALAVLLGLPAPAFRALEPGWAASERAVARGADRFLEWTRAFAFDTGRRGDRLLVWARTQGAAAARDAGERLAYALDELRFRLFP